MRASWAGLIFGELACSIEVHRCVLAADAKMSRAAIRKQYAKWCEKNGDKYPVSAARLFEAIRRHGGRDARFREHRVLVRGFEGVGLCQV
jgi:hypothetical protein